MPKPEWGAKHICQSCGTKFYDLLRSPIVCPRCGAERDAESLRRGRRSRPDVAKAVSGRPEAGPIDETEEAEEAEETEEAEEAEDGEDMGTAKTTTPPRMPRPRMRISRTIRSMATRTA